ncbi:MAG: glutamate--tRNA ligase [Patescibacteria group bacterium]|nr:glutamate--tRNA ligase [Patescibacteria group bacterium]MDE1945930.1 glutamate--tRNA ligase [Patescibacteria group bacterium]
MSNKSHIVARFPPSPTGPFHIGNARTALFNYFFVKKNGGKLLFRLEDTDRERSKQEYADDIVSGLQWLGIDIDFSHPYRQSAHSATYKKYLEQLIADGKAYVSKEEVKEAGQRAKVIRLKNPGKKVTFTDMIRGDITVDTAELGDFVIAKSVDEPIYHFAVVVDDFEMGVTHVIRGEDGIYNTPRQILIQEAIGAPRPVYAHMPFILNADRSKLSKRQAGELVSVKYYREKGYLPEAVVNYLAFLGWNPGTTREVMSVEEIISRFDITKVQKAGAIFNPEKLLWYNKEYMNRLSPMEIDKEIKKRFPKNCQNDLMIEKLSEIIVERISVWSDIDKMVADGDIQYFFEQPKFSQEMLVWKKGGTAAEARENLVLVSEKLAALADADFDAERLKSALMPLAEEKGRGNVLWPLRVALSGREKSPDPFVLLAIFGKKESLARIAAALALLK